MRIKVAVERVYNNGQNCVLQAIKEVAAEKLWNPNKGVEIVIKPEVPPPAENVSFFSASPGCEISLLMVRSPNAEEFVQGREFYVDFTPA